MTTCDSIDSVEATEHADYNSKLADKIGKHFSDRCDGGDFVVTGFGFAANDDCDDGGDVNDSKKLCFQYVRIDSDDPEEGINKFYTECSEMMAADGWVEWTA